MSKREEDRVGPAANDQKRAFARAQGIDEDTAVPGPLNLSTTSGDYGADPIGGGMHRMVPSGDIVTSEERAKRLER